MNVELIVSDDIQADPRYRGLVDRATAVMRDAVRGVDRPTETVRWEVAAGSDGGARFLVTLRDGPEMARTVFTTNELTDERDLRGRFRQVWRDLLRLRFDRLDRELTESLAAGESVQ